MSWPFLITSAFLFSSSFLCNKLFGKERGKGLRTSVEYIFFVSVVTCLSMLTISGGRPELTLFSFLLAVVYAANNFALTYFGIKALQHANLSVYSMFMMLGSIVIPSSVGVAFYDEALSHFKLLCFVCIFVALYLSTSKGQSNKKALVYYALVFTLNGMAGVISKVHQSFADMNVPTESFLFTSGAIRLTVSGAFLVYFYCKKKQATPGIKACALGLGGGLLNAVGNYFNLYALIDIPVTVHSVVTTGMVLIGSALIGLCIREKLTLRGGISLGFAIAATVLSVL